MEATKAIQQFDGFDFNQRWLKARISAFPEIDPVDGTESATAWTETTLSETFAIESNLVNLFFTHIESESMNPDEKEKAKDTLLRSIFDKSRKLALSLSKRLGLTFEVEDFQNLLTQSNIPCVQGDWTASANARTLNRKGCDYCIESGSHACDYWREALDGLVMGLGEKERLARHATVRHGDSICTDVFFTETTRSDSEALAWGPLPEHMALELFEIAAYFQRTSGISIVLKGFREGVLFFEFTSSTDLLCGNSNLLGIQFHNLVKEKFPGLSLKDVTPQAVLGTTAA